MYSNPNPINPMVNMPTMALALSNILVAVSMRYPRPLLDPIISAATVHIKAIPIPTLSPVMILGSAAGTTTFLSVWYLSAPNVEADSTYTLSILLTPSAVFMSMGKTLPTKMIKIAEPRPKPNQSMANGIQAMGGIGLKIPIVKPK